MLIGFYRRKNQGHAFVRGIALCDCIPEYDQTLCVGQTGIRFPVVTVQLPVAARDASPIT